MIVPGIMFVDDLFKSGGAATVETEGEHAQAALSKGCYGRADPAEDGGKQSFVAQQLDTDLIAIPSFTPHGSVTDALLAGFRLNRRT